VIRTTRRAFLRGSVATGSAVLLATPGLGQAKARVVVLGGGFAGASCARELQRADLRFAVTLVEENPIYTACPFSNSVIAGLRDIAAQRFGYETLRAAGIAVVHDRASSVDPQSRRRLHSGFSNGAGWRSRPWTRDRGGSPARRMSSVPYRPLRRRKVPRDAGTRSAGAGSRWSAGQLRLRLVDAIRLNPDTIMPPYYRVDGLTCVGSNWAGRPILTAEQIEDVVAFLSTLRD